MHETLYRDYCMSFLVVPNRLLREANERRLELLQTRDTGWDEASGCIRQARDLVSLKFAGSTF